MSHRAILLGFLLIVGCGGGPGQPDAGAAQEGGAQRMEVADAAVDAPAPPLERDGPFFTPPDLTVAPDAPTPDAPVDLADTGVDQASPADVQDAMPDTGPACSAEHFGLDRAQISFDTVRIGARSSATVAVKARASAAGEAVFLVLLSGASDFVVAGDSCTGTSITAGKTCEIRLEFVPTTVGERTATLNVAGSGVCRGVSATAKLTGKGAAAPAGPLMINKEEVVFPPQRNGCYYKADLVVLNTGAVPTGPLSITTASSQFITFLDGCQGQVLQPKGMCGVQVLTSPQYWPYGSHPLSGTLTVSAGAGVMDQIRLVGEALGEGWLAPSVLGLDFGDVAVGATSSPKRVTYTARDGPVVPKASTSDAAFAITQDTCSGTTLPALGATCQVEVVYRPKSTGASPSARLAVTVMQPMCSSNDHTVFLSGRGVP